MLKRFLFVLSATLLISQISTAQNSDTLIQPETKETGYFNTTELNFARGFFKDNEGVSIGLQTTNSYRFDRRISAGIGFGLDQYITRNAISKKHERSFTLLPVFSDFRIYFGKGKSQLYVSQAVGYAFCIYQPYFNHSTDYNKQIGGVIINPSIGKCISFNGKHKLNLSIGYRYQEFTIKNLIVTDNNFTPILLFNSWTASTNYINLKIGLTI